MAGSRHKKNENQNGLPLLTHDQPESNDGVSQYRARKEGKRENKNNNNTIGVADI